MEGEPRARGKPTRRAEPAPREPAGGGARVPAIGPHLQRTQMITLQTIAGNDAVRALVVQRQVPPATALGDPRWSGDTRFQAAANNSPPIRPGDPRAVVAKLQQALFDADPARYPLTLTMRTGHPDGSWGGETTTTVQQFQRDHGVSPVGGFEAGRKTLTALDAALARRVPPAPVEPTLATLAPAGAGPFQQHVSAGILDADAALLFNFMARRPGSWMFDSADLLFRDLGNGGLAGMVKWADRARLTPRVGTATATLLNSPDMGTGAGAQQILGNGGPAKGFVLIGSRLLADRNAPLRFPMLVLSHELNHYRVTEQAERIEKERAGEVSNRAEYVDVNLAKRFRTTPFVRKQFAVEVAARHVAWHVAQEYDAARSRTPTAARPMPARGALFHAAVNFAKGDPGAYHDNGYMKELATRPAAEFNRQVAIWLRLVARLDTLTFPSASDVVAAFVLAEVAHAEAIGFLPTVAPDGMA
ncbi:peptidoglycan hydrolase-like protein with peptidoglycan-binding domain [Saccharothrix tamanrassetensis]|uniref:Peptidoglycan hydrolase-like protein with peptidoglycan-binding domain n=1 Tax=Saccharothrix tamanrassetensis TaxID=1051531 RepID=A0A841CPT1_9PSEU|nr:peptidoglycan-binding domain-containing protein [Saccharothrix tamanrassetensis]MBB5958005.1 peptidoglycan hydrolase-like protein with peptidoglycan-binding domain [Saccharothrix tamanrassetensis]